MNIKFIYLKTADPATSLLDGLASNGDNMVSLASLATSLVLPETPLKQTKLTQTPDNLIVVNPPHEELN